MSQTPENEARAAAAGERAAPPAPTRPYGPPRITFREPLGTLPLVCTTGPGHPGKATPGGGGRVIGTS